MRDFIKKMLSADSDLSSKRFNGTYGFAMFCGLIIFIILYDKLDDGVWEPVTMEVLKLLGYLSSALLGLGILDRFKSV